MTARKPPAVTYLGNVNLSLRVISIWIDAKGHTTEIDAPIIGWALDGASAPIPITPVGVPAQAALVVIRDHDTKTWIDSEGHVYREWKQVLAPLFAAYDKRVKTSGSPPEPAREPDPDVWGTGQAPRPWKPGRT
jgi:hypothetical protein